MSKKQKFQRGNLVEVLVGHKIWSSDKGAYDADPDQVGKKAIIQYSYAEKYGGGNTTDYSIMFLDTGGTVAWKDESELKLLEKGGEHLFEQAKKNAKALEDRDKDLTYIKEVLSRLKKEDRGLSSTSILYLFDMLGYKSAFLTNGEFFTLYTDWAILGGIFQKCAAEESYGEVLEFALTVIKPKYISHYNIKEVYEAFKKIKDY